MGGSHVCLNLYDLNPVMELVNRLVLRKNQMGVFHCGIELHRTEYAFVFAADTNKTGIRRFVPKESLSYKFCESIDIGWTDLSIDEAQDLIFNLTFDWPADTYHISRRNCVHFAEALIGALGLHQHFPEWLKSISETAIQSPAVASTIDSLWLCATWCMRADSSALDCTCRPCQCCTTCSMEKNATMCRGCQPSFNDQGLEGSFGNSASAQMEAVLPVYNITEAVASLDATCVNPCERYDAFAEWPRRPRRKTSV